MTVDGNLLLVIKKRYKKDRFSLLVLGLFGYCVRV
jgi:hypothetical protein